MARRRVRTRAARGNVVSRSPAQQLTFDSVAGFVPGVLLAAVDGVGVVAGGVLHLTRNVLMSAVSGGAEIGAEAVNATVFGAHGVVSATSRMIGDLAGAAQASVKETFSVARQVGRRATSRRPPAVAPSRLAPVPGPATRDAARARRRRVEAA